MIAPRSLTIVCDGTAKPLAPSGTQAKWVQITTGGANSANVNLGDSTIVAPTVSPATDGVGYPVTPGFSGQFLPPIAELYSFYSLDQIYQAGVIGDILYLIYGG